ncbi:MAG: LysE family transporter [Thermoanaerobaculia bacterium]|nr:LysE family transporter [Thermoanaerobaculia bacterium]
MDLTLVGAAGLLLAGAITPGPNNLVVMREAARAGWSAAIPAIVGTVLGGIALLIVVFLGLGVTLEYQPQLISALGVVGCLYLLLLGLRIAIPGQSPIQPIETGKQTGKQTGKLPAGIWGLVLFQTVNPKAWLVVLTVTSSVRGPMGASALAPLLALFIVIPTSCLGLWSWIGVSIERSWQADHLRRLDRFMGVLLVASALLLLYSTLESYK